MNKNSIQTIFKNSSQIENILGEKVFEILITIVSSCSFSELIPYTNISNNDIRNVTEKKINDKLINDRLKKLEKFEIIKRETELISDGKGRYSKKRIIKLNFTCEEQLINILNKNIENNVIKNKEPIIVKEVKNIKKPIITKIIEKVLNNIKPGRSLTLSQIQRRITKEIDKIWSQQNDIIKEWGKPTVTLGQINRILYKHPDFQYHKVTENNIKEYKLNKKLEYGTIFYTKK